MPTFLLPGEADPNGTLASAAFARRLGVSATTMRDWVDAGLPTSPGGDIEPFAGVAWICRHRLAACPVLERRWRHWWSHSAADARQRRPRRLRVRRRHRLFLPGSVDDLRWYLPRLLAGHGQPRVETFTPVAAEGAMLAQLPAHDVLTWNSACASATAEAEDRVWIVPAPPEDHADLRALMADLGAEFRYAYRRHQPWSDGDTDLEGSCFDLCLLLGRHLSDRGRPWRLGVGVIASSRVANPHFWVECAGPGGTWITLDPTLPAVAKLLGHDVAAAAHLACGGWSGRFVRLASGSVALARIPGGASVDSLIGEAVARVDGRARNAWPCLDWACGVCSWAFTAD